MHRKQRSNMKLILGIFAFLGFSQDSYGTELEKYIVSHAPKHTADIERLTIEYQLKQARSFL